MKIEQPPVSQPGEPGKTLLVNRIGGALCSLGTGLNVRLLEKVRPLAPDRIEVPYMVDHQQCIECSAGFTTAEGQDMAEVGTLDLSVLEKLRSPLDEVNEAIAGITQQNGGFSNFAIQP